jgi:hypothetical protein
VFCHYLEVSRLCRIVSSQDEASPFFFVWLFWPIRAEWICWNELHYRSKPFSDALTFKKCCAKNISLFCLPINFWYSTILLVAAELKSRETWGQEKWKFLTASSDIERTIEGSDPLAPMWPPLVSDQDDSSFAPKDVAHFSYRESLYFGPHGNFWPHGSYEPFLASFIVFWVNHVLKRNRTEFANNLRFFKTFIKFIYRAFVIAGPSEKKFEVSSSIRSKLEALTALLTKRECTASVRCFQAMYLSDIES